MGVFAAGQVVTLPFPFSDLSRDKPRPVLLLADAGREDWIVCQITSNPNADLGAIPLSHDDFVEGGLRHKLRASGKTVHSKSSAHRGISRLGSSIIPKRVRDALIAIIRSFSRETKTYSSRQYTKVLPTLLGHAE